MTFKKLVLVSAMFAATSGAYAMEAMDEEALAATTGQDGITINLSTSAAVDVIIHDKDGFADPQGVAANDRLNSGAIVLRGIALGNAIDGTTGAVTGDALVKIDVDAGAPAAGSTTADSTLNIGITLGTAGATPVNTVIDLGTLRVANSAREGGVGWGIDAGSESASLLDLGQLTMGGGTKLNIQLGNEPQGDLIALNTTLTNGLTLTDVSLNDVNSGGAISVGTLSVSDAGAGANLVVDLGINATATGLSIRVDTLGTGGMDITMANVKIGDATAASIGDVEINGLNLSGDTITISGH